MSNELKRNKSDIRAAFARHVSSGKVAFYEQAGLDFIMGRREGIYMWDLDGERRLINCHSNGGVFNLGHRNPRVIAAVRQALERLDIGNHHLVSAARAELGERLAAIAPGDINRVIYGVSGGEASDTAIKLARAHTRRNVIISGKGGYHGHTGYALAAGDAQYREPFGPRPAGFEQVPFNDLAALEAALHDDVAAVIFETIPATLGMPLPEEGFYSGVRALCDRHGALMIMDEVQTGLGRCGAYWGVDTYGIVPDIIITAKGLSGGIYPITATLYRDKLNAFMHENPFIHISTYGGAELGCVAALAVLDQLEEPGFLEHVRSVAAQFGNGLDELQARYPGVLVEVRQRGLMMGLRLGHPQAGMIMTRLGVDAGLFAVYANNDPSVLQLLPPLIIEPDEVKLVLGMLDRMLDSLAGLLSG